MLGIFPLVVFVLMARLHTAEAAATHLSSTYLPDWEALYIREGEADYPFPASAEVHGLLDALAGVGGLARRFVTYSIRKVVPGGGADEADGACGGL